MRICADCGQLYKSPTRDGYICLHSGAYIADPENTAACGNILNKVKVGVDIPYGADRPNRERIGCIEMFLAGALGCDPDHLIGDPWKHGVKCREKLLSAIQLAVVENKTILDTDSVPPFNCA